VSGRICETAGDGGVRAGGRNVCQALEQVGELAPESTAACLEDYPGQCDIDGGVAPTSVHPVDDHRAVPQAKDVLPAQITVHHGRSMAPDRM
jgi:hypothetical protein